MTVGPTTGRRDKGGQVEGGADAGSYENEEADEKAAQKLRQSTAKAQGGGNAAKEGERRRRLERGRGLGTSRHGNRTATSMVTSTTHEVLEVVGISEDSKPNKKKHRKRRSPKNHPNEIYSNPPDAAAIEPDLAVIQRIITTIQSTSGI